MVAKGDFKKARKRVKKILSFTEEMIENGFGMVGGKDDVLEVCLKIARDPSNFSTYYDPSLYLHEYLELCRREIFRAYFNNNKEKAWAHYKIADDMYLSGQIFYTVDYLIFHLTPTTEDEYVLLPKKSL